MEINIIFGCVFSDAEDGDKNYKFIRAVDKKYTMIADDLQQQITKLGEEHWEGRENFVIRAVTYIRRGNGLFNEFKNYIMFAFASYWTIKTADYWIAWALADSWLIIGFAILLTVGIVLFFLAGRYDLQKMNKTTDYVTTIKGSIFQYKPMQMSIEQVQLLGQILEEMKKLKK